LRGLAVASGRSGAALRRLLPRGGTYFNVGHANLAALAPLGAAGFRRVVMVHDTIPLDFPQFARDPARFRRRLALVARHADQVVCPSGAAMQDVARWCGNLGRVPPILVAPLGVVAAAPGTIPDGLGRYRDGFMAIGTVEPRKNHGLLLDVWEQLSRDTADVPPLLIVGSRGWKNADLLRRIDRLDPEGPVRMVSGLGDGAVSALVAGARAVLMPSLAEGFGLPAVEAAAAGTPVVCAPLPVYREILGDYPVYVDPADLYSWVETIRKLAEQRGRRPTLAGDLVIPTWENHFNLVSDMA
jgi:glycosyltransferase involved in cell wall biosynthesis